MSNKKKIALLAAMLAVSLLVCGILLTPKPIRNLIFRSVFPLTPLDERRLINGFDERSVVKIGIAGPIEDIMETNLFLEGVSMAISEYNTSGLLPVTVEVEIVDDHNRIADVLTVAGNFAKNTDIIAVIGHWGSEFSVAAAQIYENADIIMLTPVSTNPKLTENGLSLVFRNAPTDVAIGNLLAGYAKKQGYRNIAAVYSSDMTGIHVAHSFESAAAANGINILDKHAIYSNLESFDRKYERWREDGLNALLIADIITRNEDFQQRLIAKNPSLPILATDAYDYDIPLRNLAKKSHSLHVVTFFNPGSDNEAYTSFCSRFEALYGRKPDYWALQGYDSVAIIIEAIKRAGSFDAESVAAALKDTENPFQSVTGGTIMFDGHGNVISPNLYIKQIIDGKTVFWEAK